MIGTKAPFKGGFAFGWLSTYLCPLSELRFVYKWGQQDEHTGTKRDNHVMHGPFGNSQLRFRALCDTFGICCTSAPVAESQSCLEISNQSFKLLVSNVTWQYTLMTISHLKNKGKKPVFFCSNRFKSLSVVESPNITLCADRVRNRETKFWRIVNCVIWFRSARNTQKLRCLMTELVKRCQLSID